MKIRPISRDSQQLNLLRLTLVLIIIVSLSSAVVNSASYTVNSTNDPGDGTPDAAETTLREAIDAANANIGTDTIAFNIGGGGIQTIVLQSALPPISDPVETEWSVRT